MNSRLLAHTCNILKREKKQKLNFDTGTGTFTKGLTVSGATSKATAVIDKVSGTATGYLVLKNITGTFQNDEILTDTGSGAAVANGVCTDWQNSYGEYEYYWPVDQSSVDCRFYYAGNKGQGKTRVIHETGQLIDLPLSLILPGTVTVETLDYRIDGTSGPFQDVYSIETCYSVSGRAAIDHYELVLKKVQS